MFAAFISTIFLSNFLPGGVAFFGFDATVACLCSLPRMPLRDVSILFEAPLPYLFATNLTSFGELLRKEIWEEVANLSLV